MNMNKILIAILGAGIITVNPAHAEITSGSKHVHDKTTSASEVHEQEEGTSHQEHEPNAGDEDASHANKENHPNGSSDSEGHGDEHSEGDGKEDERGHGETANSALLSTSQMTLADIQVGTLTAKKVNFEFYAPGEILSNGYTSYQVSPRVPSVVLRRHVALGDHVKQGQPLVTLFSESVAQAQADYRTAWPEWQRVRELGRKTVGEQRYIRAKASWEAARATLQAYGLIESDLKSLASQNIKALGQYTLRAETDGSVLSDDFEQGQRVESGTPLIKLANEKQLWVEAHLPADRSLSLPVGTLADIVAGDLRVQGKVSQEAHTIDPVTRTRTVRLLVNNREHKLHPGQFAEVFFRFRTEKPVLAVQESALMRNPDGDWAVYVEVSSGKYRPVEVELGRALGALREITGIEPGVRIVTNGAFFVASQIAKGGFDPHNH